MSISNRICDPATFTEMISPEVPCNNRKDLFLSECIQPLLRRLNQIPFRQLSVLNHLAVIRDHHITVIGLMETGIYNSIKTVMPLVRLISNSLSLYAKTLRYFYFALHDSLSTSNRKTATALTISLE